MLFNTVSLLAALPAVLALPTYSIPKSFTKFLLANACTYPEAYEIQNFQTFTPAAGNSTTADISFSFNDKDTNIQTFCQRNSTSKNVGKPDLAARYACDNTVVEFIWQSEKLTMIETACPGNTGTDRWEASGSVKPALNCAATGCNSTQGDGTRCSATVLTMQANFTSLQPSPQ